MSAPLTITRGEAAELCHLSPSGFDVWVRKGIVPGPVAGTRRWSRAAIENAVNGKQHDNDDDPEAAYRRWKESRAG